jgi:hypothetical protein
VSLRRSLNLNMGTTVSERRLTLAGLRQVEWQRDADAPDQLTMWQIKRQQTVNVGAADQIHTAQDARCQHIISALTTAAPSRPSIRTVSVRSAGELMSVNPGFSDRVNSD